MAKRKYSAEFKFQAGMELLKRQKEIGQVARAYGVHPIPLKLWKKELMEHGPEVFGGSDTIRRSEQKLRDLERLLGQKKVEIARYKSFPAEN